MALKFDINPFMFVIWSKVVKVNAATYFDGYSLWTQFDFTVSEAYKS